MTVPCTVEKSVVAIVREFTLLAFRHPQAGVQLPKGTRELGESPEETARREVFEEVGVVLSEPLLALGQWICPDPTSIWNVFVADAPPGLPPTWRHAPSGSDEERRHVFDVIWVRMGDALDVFHPLFHPVLNVVCAHLDQVGNTRASQS
ncbi:NUDIX domain-containing protein [uncultured Tateyamaria sp.]|uniref:NUDIX domain-containing protein n=1 Tax=uncultured Tateyamaria sp. TaxID=455651 RepID=UPI002632AD76|nr:NUDIX domain-containing protein [uncultured Tateyamaria sp.]